MVQLKCEFCDKTLSGKYRLKIHINSVHLNLKPFSCKECDMSFSQKFNLKRHILSVHERSKPFACTDCDKEFGQKINLKNHRRSVHSKEDQLPEMKHFKISPAIFNPFLKIPCVQCDLRFQSQEKVIEHVESHHIKIEKTLRF